MSQDPITMAKNTRELASSDELVQIDITRLRAKLMHVLETNNRGGLSEKASNIVLAIDSFHFVEKKITKLRHLGFFSKVLAVAISGIIGVSLLGELLSPSTSFVTAVQIPMDPDDALQSVDTFVSILIGLFFSIFFIARSIQREIDRICLHWLDVLHETIHLIDAMHLGKEVISLGFNHQDSDDIEFEHRRTKSKNFLESLIEIVGIGSRVSMVYSKLDGGFELFEKQRAVESLAHFVTSSISRKIDSLEKL